MQMMMMMSSKSTELDLLFLVGEHEEKHHHKEHKKRSREFEFECNTCGRCFSSFQALGGHRTSHKRSRPIDGDNNKVEEEKKKKKKMMTMMMKRGHECSVCGVEFERGQALGGHMRRHNPVLKKRKKTNDNKVMFLDLNLFPWENDLYMTT